MPLYAGDWKDAAAYQPLTEMDRVGWAWAWLRRNPLYQVRSKPDLSHDGDHSQNEVQIIRARSATDAGHWGVSFRP
ncbi:transcriptional regulator domain-containing protein [Asticcacaulis aquaticus]|uniref:transcriptional regulator domain-containing protein n=1 Tax=Asticcacaulis aquaticus TaxID=2984212 RepID=UPI0034A19FAE